MHSSKDTLGREGYACSPGAHEGHRDTHFPFLLSWPPESPSPSLRAPIHSADEDPHKTPPFHHPFLAPGLDAHTLSLALITKATPLWPRLASGLPPRDGAVPLCSHNPTVQTQAPYPRLTGDWFTALERPAFPFSQPKAPGSALPKPPSAQQGLGTGASAHDPGLPGGPQGGPQEPSPQEPWCHQRSFGGVPVMLGEGDTKPQLHASLAGFSASK